MIQITNLSQFNRAKLRASAGKLTATTSTVWRVYRVTNEEKGVTYRVSFWRDSNGRKWTTCECAGAQGGYVCKHMGAALPRQTPNPAFEPAPGKFTDPEDADADCDSINWQ